MPCYHPLKGFIVGFHESTCLDKDKNILSKKAKDLIITSYDIDHLEQPFDSNSYLKIKDKKTEFINSRRVDNFVDIPCGHCIGCRLDYGKEWAARVLCELQSMPKGSNSWFVTFTYDDGMVQYSDRRFGDWHPQTLCRRDWTLFMKRLRKAVEPKKLRYFCAGEYGDCTFRPHVHAILFNLDIPDLRPFRVIDGHVYYLSDWLQNIWKNGNILIGSVTAETAAYTARYCVKKAFDSISDDYEYLGIEPEFVSMSRRPGIGKSWLDCNFEDVLKHPVINLSSENHGNAFAIPRYFMLKLGESTQQNNRFVERLKDHKRKVMMQRRKIEDTLCNKSYLERLEDLEALRIKQLKKRRDQL